MSKFWWKKCHTQTCCWQIFIIFNLNFLINFRFFLWWTGNQRTCNQIFKKIDTMLFWLKKGYIFFIFFFLSLSLSPQMNLRLVYSWVSQYVCLVAAFNFIQQTKPTRQNENWNVIIMVINTHTHTHNNNHHYH